MKVDLERQNKRAREAGEEFKNVEKRMRETKKEREKVCWGRGGGGEGGERGGKGREFCCSVLMRGSFFVLFFVFCFYF